MTQSFAEEQVVSREHLPFDVVLPLASEPRQLITALRHLLH